MEVVELPRICKVLSSVQFWGGVSNGREIYTNGRVIRGTAICFGCLDSDQIASIDFSFWRTQRISNARIKSFYGVLAEIGTLSRLLHCNRSGYT